MCTCASCKYTDSFKEGFATWPRGEPAGKRSSESAYATHVRHYQAGAYKHVAFTPGQAPRYPSTGTRQADSGAYRQYPSFHEEQGQAVYIAEFIKKNGYKRQEPVKAPASPAQACKPEPHLPEPDRRPEPSARIYLMDKAKRKTGRPPIGDKTMKKVLVTLDEVSIERAKQLGKQNVSAGIRKALARRSG